MLIPEDSPLRWLPHPYSKQQVLVFDGITYAAEMADIAYTRLKQVCSKSTVGLRLR
jgi:hypothetical protein